MNKVWFDKLPGCPKMARRVLSTSVIPHPPTNIKFTTHANIYHSHRVDSKMDHHCPIKCQNMKFSAREDVFSSTKLQILKTLQYPLTVLPTTKNQQISTHPNSPRKKGYMLTTFFNLFFSFFHPRILQMGLNG